jgi:uracil DNA glycosylase
MGTTLGPIGPGGFSIPDRCVLSAPFTRMTQEVDQLLEYVAQPVHPRHDDLFAAFRLTTYDDVRAVAAGSVPHRRDVHRGQRAAGGSG